MTKNHYTTLVSQRIENETLQAINKFKETHFYWSRSDIINIVLRRVFIEMDAADRWRFFDNTKSFSL